MVNVKKIQKSCLGLFIVALNILFVGGCSKSSEQSSAETAQYSQTKEQVEKKDETSFDSINKEVERVLQYNKKQDKNSDLKFIRKIVLNDDSTLTVFVMDQFAVFQSPKKKNRIINYAQKLVQPIIGYHLNLPESQDKKGIKTKVILEDEFEGNSRKENNFDFEWDYFHLDLKNKEESGKNEK